jgi:hypothetical protein
MKPTDKAIVRMVSESPGPSVARTCVKDQSAGISQAETDDVAVSEETGFYLLAIEVHTSTIPSIFNIELIVDIHDCRTVVRDAKIEEPKIVRGASTNYERELG